MAYELFLSYDQFRNQLLQENIEASIFNYRADDLPRHLVKHNLYNENTSQAVQNLDRFYYSFSNDDMDLTVGRQIISFGSARIVNPMDVLVPFDFVMVNMEQRNGIDGARLKLPWGNHGEWDFGFITGDEFKSKNNAGFFRVKIPSDKIDLSLLAMRFREHRLYGVNIEIELGGWATWLEVGDVKLITDESFVRLSLGGHYHFKFDLSLVMEYHYSEVGSGNVSDYLLVAQSSAFQEAGVFLVGKNYFNTTLAYSVNPLLSLSTSLMHNLGDSSTLVAPQLEWNVSENIFWNLGVFLGLGKSPGNVLNLESEFGSYNSSIYTMLKHYY
ncbi:hypothetical protein OAT67_04645 [Bacteriovoracaceae bacterium]|nr:hypothetical protein [Bacteriovoracaceae bacterium]